MEQSEGFLCWLSGPLLKTRLPFLGNVLKPLGKTILIPLQLTAAALPADAPIHKKIFGSGTCPFDLAKWTALTISNEEVNDITKIVRSFGVSGLLKF